MWRVPYVISLTGAFLLASPQSASSDEPLPEIVSVKKIWDKAKYNMCTDLLRFEDRWWCSFREGTQHHAGDIGTTRVIVSDDGESWSSAAHVVVPDVDLGGGKLSIMPDGRLMCMMQGNVYKEDGAYLFRRPWVCFSANGFKWTKPVALLKERPKDEDHSLWRPTWHKGVCWCMSKIHEGTVPRRLMLFKSTNGLNWKFVTEPILPDNARNGSETTVRFLPDDTMVALTRPEWIGTSRPPYREWQWTRIRPKRKPGNRDGEIGGPNFLRLPDGSLWGSARRYTRPKKTVLARMTTTSYKPVLELPSGGDNSYPGMVFNEDDGLLWMSYYSGHEGKVSIYLAKIRVPLR